MLGQADVAERDERVTAQEARIVPRHIEPVVVVDQRVRLEPLDEIDVAGAARDPVGRGASARHGSTGRRPGRCRSRTPAHRAPTGTPRESPPAPASSTRGTWSRRGCPGSSSAPVGHASIQILQSPQSVSSGGVVSSSRSLTSVPSTTHEPCAACDQHRVLAVEPDAAAHGRLTVDVLVRVDEHAIGSTDRASERGRAACAARRRHPPTCTARGAPPPAASGASGCQ